MVALSLGLAVAAVTAPAPAQAAASSAPPAAQSRHAADEADEIAALAAGAGSMVLVGIGAVVCTRPRRRSRRGATGGPATGDQATRGATTDQSTGSSAPVDGDGSTLGAGVVRSGWNTHHR